MRSERCTEYLGLPLTSQLIVPGDTTQGVAANVQSYKQEIITYTAGSSIIAVGDTINGGTSAKTATVLSVTNAGGWAGAGTGTITICSNSGLTTAELIKVKTVTCATMTLLPAADPTDYPYKGAQAKCMVVQAMANPALITFDGSTPDQTTARGITLAATSVPFYINDPQAIISFGCLNATAATATKVAVVCYF